MRDALPPLAPVPHLTRLLWPEEEVIYTAKLHWLNGWLWLVGALVCALLTLRVHPAFVGLMVVLLGVYGVVFKTNEIAVTTHRLLVRVGRVKLLMLAVEPAELADWTLQQNPLTNILNAGLVTLMLRAGRDVSRLTLPWLAHPLTFLEALETLEYRKAQLK